MNVMEKVYWGRLMIKRNPKQEGSNLWDCKPQIGPCPNNCNQCFYNRPNAFYIPIARPIIPTREEVGSGIVRLNCGHDSNIQRDLVVQTAKCYDHFFFNTSIPQFVFPGPVVFTANPKEEDFLWMPEELGCSLHNIMFVRFRVSASNLDLIKTGVEKWAIEYHIPVVLTFMAYYDHEPSGVEHLGHADEGHRLKDRSEFGKIAYIWKKRHINSYYCATYAFQTFVLKKMKNIGGRLVTMCGTLDSTFCRDCRNCETYYWQTLKHMKEIGYGK